MTMKSLIRKTIKRADYQKQPHNYNSYTSKVLKYYTLRGLATSVALNWFCIKVLFSDNYRFTRSCKK